MAGRTRLKDNYGKPDQEPGELRAERTTGADLCVASETYSNRARTLRKGMRCLDGLLTYDAAIINSRTIGADIRRYLSGIDRDGNIEEEQESKDFWDALISLRGCLRKIGVSSASSYLRASVEAALRGNTAGFRTITAEIIEEKLKAPSLPEEVRDAARRQLDGWVIVVEMVSGLSKNFSTENNDSVHVKGVWANAQAGRGEITNLSDEFEKHATPDAGEVLSRLSARLIPTIGISEIQEIEDTLRLAQAKSPADKRQFVSRLNRLLDVFQLRVEVKGDEVDYRLRVSENALGVESIKLVGKERGKSRGFQNTSLSIVTSTPTSTARKNGAKNNP